MHISQNHLYIVCSAALVRALNFYPTLYWHIYLNIVSGLVHLGGILTNLTTTLIVDPSISYVMLMMLSRSMYFIQFQIGDMSSRKDLGMLDGPHLRIVSGFQMLN
jgi:hypothetical protein